MFIGHIPAGYITSKLLYPPFEKFSPQKKKFIFWGILGACVPDIDLLYFYLIDHRQHHHHKYFTHYPLFWLALLFASLLWLKLKPSTGSLAFIFCVGGMGHMVLDTIVGDIWWLAPFYDKPFSFFVVHAHLHPWWLNFILHWSFGAELLLVFIALYMLKKAREKSDRISAPGNTIHLR